MNNIKTKTKKSISLKILIFFLFGSSFLIAENVFAISFKPQVLIDGFTGGTIGPDSIGEYILAIYNYAIGTVGVLATVVMMYAGVLWITAAGNTEQISTAKSYIASSLTGLVLLLCSWMILWTVNPDLTSFKSITPVPVGIYTPPPAVSTLDDFDPDFNNNLPESSCQGDGRTIRSCSGVSLCRASCGGDDNGYAFPNIEGSFGNCCCICI